MKKILLLVGLSLINLSLMLNQSLARNIIVADFNATCDEGCNNNPPTCNNPNGFNEIRNQQDLLNINLNDWDDYVLCNNIPLNNSFYPIENFSGTLNGNNYAIQNLDLELPDDNYVGLFRFNQGFIYNLRLENPNVTGKNSVGTLVGDNSGTIQNITVTGAGSATGPNLPTDGEGIFIGGLIGFQSYGYTDGITFDVSNFEVRGRSAVGGIIGSMQGQEAIGSQSFLGNASINVDAIDVNAFVVEGQYSVGGLVGLVGDSSLSPTEEINFIERAHVYALVRGNKITDDSSGLGGLVGAAYDMEMQNAYHYGFVNGFSSGANIGGAVGFATRSILEGTAAKSNVYGLTIVGGLVGFASECLVTNSYSQGIVFANAGSTYIGGLIGYFRDFEGNRESKVRWVYSTVDLLNVPDDPTIHALIGSVEQNDILNEVEHAFFEQNFGDPQYPSDHRGEARETWELQDILNYPELWGWSMSFNGEDSDSTWKIPDNNIDPANYPHLRLEDPTEN